MSDANKSVNLQQFQNEADELKQASKILITTASSLGDAIQRSLNESNAEYLEELNTIHTSNVRLLEDVVRDSEKLYDVVIEDIKEDLKLFGTI